MAQIIGLAVMAYGQIESGRAAKAQAESQQAMMNYNAAIQEREAKAIEQKTAFEQARQVKRAKRIKSALRTKMAGSGARMDVGAPLMLQEEQAAELELENLLIGYEGEVGAQRERSQKELDIIQGRIYKQRGRAAQRASYYKAGSTLLTGFGEAWS